MATLRPAERVEGVSAYRVPGRVGPIDLDLRGNEGARRDPALWRALGTADLLRRYPDVSQVRATLAKRLGVEPCRVLVTAGGDDALDRLCRAVLEPGRSLIFPEPGFEMTRRYAHLAGAEIVSVPWPDAGSPIAGILAAIDPRTGLIALTSPNNPTGATLSPDDLLVVSRAAREVGAVVLVDLAYGEFADHDLTPLAASLDNTVVVRTLSKAWGLAGLRIGYAVGPVEVLDWMRVAGAPYAVSAPSLAIAAAALGESSAPVDAFVQTVREGRARLEAALETAGCTVVPSQANFVFARSERVDWLADGLAGLGIGVRTFESPSLRDAVRIACPPERSGIARLERAITAVASPAALLFDMDGVLVDVSRSYRAAILGTAAELGVTLTPADVSEVKARGDANNDWIVTQRLLAERGVECSLTEVTEVFERLYQGTAETEGLRATETLLCSPALLLALKQRVRVGVVTGRPREDAI